MSLPTGEPKVAFKFCSISVHNCFFWAFNNLRWVVVFSVPALAIVSTTRLITVYSYHETNSWSCGEYGNPQEFKLTLAILKAENGRRLDNQHLPVFGSSHLVRTVGNIPQGPLLVPTQSWGLCERKGSVLRGKANNNVVVVGELQLNKQRMVMTIDLYFTSNSAMNT